MLIKLNIFFLFFNVMITEVVTKLLHFIRSTAYRVKRISVVGLLTLALISNV